MIAVKEIKLYKEIQPDSFHNRIGMLDWYHIVLRCKELLYNKAEQNV